MAKVDFEKYRKPEKCSYPWSPEPLGYCWGYAENKDAGMTDEEIEKELCEGCEYKEEE